MGRPPIIRRLDVRINGRVAGEYRLILRAASASSMIPSGWCGSSPSRSRGRFANSLRLSVMSIKTPAEPDGLWLKPLPGRYHVVKDHKR